LRFRLLPHGSVDLGVELPQRTIPALDEVVYPVLALRPEAPWEIAPDQAVELVECLVGFPRARPPMK
jgi:hypothetical protein